jgi:hypothetical protein
MTNTSKAANRRQSAASKLVFGVPIVICLGCGQGPEMTSLGSHRTFASHRESDILPPPTADDRQLLEQSTRLNPKLVRVTRHLGQAGQDDGDHYNSAAYRSAELDLNSMTMRVRDYLGRALVTSRHFVRSRMAQGNEIADCESSASGNPQVCYNLFVVDIDGHLKYRTKYLALFTGPFGTVYSKAFYEYRPDVKLPDRDQPVRLPNQLETFVRDYDLPYVPSDVRETFLENGQLPLSAISVVRIFRNGNKWVNVSGNYSSDGHLYEITVDNVSRIGDNARAGEFGIPEAFPITSYLSTAENPFGTASLPVEVGLVILHYDESYVVRRDVYKPGERRTSVFLVFPQTNEDRLLREIDRTRDFAEMFYTR